MFTVTLPTAAKDKIKTVENFLNHELLHNINLNDQEFEIETSLDQDCASIDGIDEYVGVVLLNHINKINNSEDFEEVFCNNCGEFLFSDYNKSNPTLCCDDCKV